MKSFYLLLTVSIASVVRAGVNVDFFQSCSDGNGYDYLVGDYTQFVVTMDGYNWLDDSLSCTVVFKAERKLSDLFYKFKSFRLEDTGTQIRLESKYISFYTSEALYDMDLNPYINLKLRTNRYLKVTVTRSTSTTISLSANIQVYIHEGTLSTGGIVGVIFGAILLCVVVIIIIVGVYNRHKRNSIRGVVVAPANRHVTTTTTVMNVPGYGYTAPHVQLGVHPAYQQYPTGGYPFSPQAYPPGQPYGAAPPAYSTLINGNANQGVQKTANS